MFLIQLPFKPEQLAVPGFDAPGEAIKIHSRTRPAESWREYMK
jgi:hypothetical protein